MRLEKEFIMSKESDAQLVSETEEKINEAISYISCKYPDFDDSDFMYAVRLRLDRVYGINVLDIPWIADLFQILLMQ